MTFKAGFVAVGIALSVLSAQAAVVKRPAIVPRFSGAAVGEWTMDLDAALTQAREGTNNVVVMFTGAWWCPHCQALEDKVLTQPAWQEYVASNRLYLVMMDFPGRADQYWCWMRETNYVESVGLTLAQGEAEITNRYAVQTSFAVPGAPTNTVKGVSYLRVGYPTLLALRPDGTRLGRFSPLMTTVSMEMVLRNMDQLLGADGRDETDNYYQDATLLETPACEDEEQSAGLHSLSEADAADWFCFDAAAGVQWSFALRSTAGSLTNGVKMQIFSYPTNAASVAERVMAPSDISVLTCTVPQAGRYWLKISSAQSLAERQAYDLAYWYGVSPAEVVFSASQVSVSERAATATLTVQVVNAAADAEVQVGYETVAGSATPNEDYVPVTGRLVWEPGVKTPKTITVPLLLDVSPAWEGNETFAVRLVTVKNCSINEGFATCTVVLTESSARQAGKLGFDGAPTAFMVEGSNAWFSVSRTDGVDGVVTGKVEHVQGAVRTPVAELVWANRETGSKTFSFGFPAEAGYQADRSSALRLTATGGGGLNASRTAISLVRRDDLVVQTLAELNAVPENQAFGFRALGGVWFYGYCSDAERDEAWLRCTPLPQGGSSQLSASAKGPGVLSFDWRLSGADVTLRALIGSSVKETLAATGTGKTLAVPAGSQNVSWLVRRGTAASSEYTSSGYGAWVVRGGAASSGDVFGAVRNIVWWPLPQVSGPWPSSGAAVINRDLRLSWLDVLAASGVPAGASARYEVYAGLSSAAMSLRSEQTAAAFPRDGNADDQAVFDALVTDANTRPIYWRVDAVATDASGRRAVYRGQTWTLTVLPVGAPELVASAGGYDPAQVGGVTLPDMVVGVYAETGPFAAATVAGDAVSGVIKNGALPAGMKTETRDGAIWIARVPQRAGEGSADLHLSVRRMAGAVATTVAGSSVRVAWKVLTLGRAAGQFNGLLLEEGTAGCGNTSLTVASNGKTTGKFFYNGLPYTVSSSHFAGRNSTGYFANSLAVSGTNRLAVAVSVASGGEYAWIHPAGVADAEYLLWRNNWKDAGMDAVLGAYAGYYTAALPVLESTSGDNSWGTGFLTVNIGKSGTVSYSGQMADGKTVSGSSPLLYGPDCCSLDDRVFFYVFATPSGYGKSGHLYGLVYLVPGTQPTPNDNALESSAQSKLRWTHTDPKSVYGYNPVTGELPNGIAGFTNLLDVTGGYFDRTLDLRTVYADTWLSIGSAFLAPADYDGEQGQSGYALASLPKPARLPAVATGLATLSFPKSVRVMNGSLVDFDLSTNAWNMAVLPNRSTGVFSGSFKIFYQGLDGYGIARQKTKTVTLRGVFLPVRAEGQTYADWMGYYLVPDKYRYQGATGAVQNYSFNWSVGFWMGVL